jgi:hypothetical protein
MDINFCLIKTKGATLAVQLHQNDIWLCWQGCRLNKQKRQNKIVLEYGIGQQWYYITIL